MVKSDERRMVHGMANDKEKGGDQLQNISFAVIPFLNDLKEEQNWIHRFRWRLVSIIQSKDVSN